MAQCGDMGKRGLEARAKWQRMVAEQRRSGNSVAAFCRERGLCAASFFAWKKRLNEAEKFMAVQVLEADEPASSRAIEVRLDAGRSIIVEPGFDAAQLRAVVAALERSA